MNAKSSSSASGPHRPLDPGLSNRQFNALANAATGGPQLALPGSPEYCCIALGLGRALESLHARLQARAQRLEDLSLIESKLDKYGQQEISASVSALLDLKQGKLDAQAAAELTALTQAADIDGLRLWLLNHHYLEGA
jgi:hypothetical protein